MKSIVRERAMNNFLAAFVLSMAVSVPAYSQTESRVDDSIAGAHAVTFQPTQVGGTLVGCALVYRAVQFDYAYLGGKPVVAVGNIGINQTGGKMALTLKLGVKALTGDTPFVSPTFTYLQTKNASTAKVKQVGQEIEKGFRYTVYSFYDPAVQQVVNDMIDSQKITLAFNRKANGLDVLIPIDLDVIDATYPGGNAVARIRSKETMNNFIGCFLKLLDQAKTSIERK
jgi:hypothetical protein